MSFLVESDAFLANSNEAKPQVNKPLSRVANLSQKQRELLARQLQQRGRQNFSYGSLIPKRTQSAFAPLFFSQQRLWFLNQLEVGSAYNIFAVHHLAGSLNVDVLKQSLTEIIRRHEALRTAFSFVEGQLVGVVIAEPSLPLPVINLRNLPETEQDEQVQQFITREKEWGFDLAKGPLLRTTLLQLSDEEYIFILVVHHIVFDGWSKEILFRELSTLYNAFAKGKLSPLAELPIQYGDFAAWQQERLYGEVLKNQLAYWKKQLNDAPPLLCLPTDRPRPAVQSFRGAKQFVIVPKPLTNALKQLGQQQNATLFMTLLTAFKVLLHRYSRQDDIVVGAPIANRNRTEVEDLIGFFANTLVLRTSCSNDPGFRDLLKHVREVTLGAYAHQDLPFEKLVEELQPERDLSYNPIFQVMFNLLNLPKQALELDEVDINPLLVQDDTEMFDLTFKMTEDMAGLKGEMSYNTDLFEAATIERMARHFQVLLESIIANPDMPISQLPLLTQSEQHQLLVGRNNTQVNYPQDKCIHQLFEARVEKTPDVPVVVFEEQQLTYRQLNIRANQVAHHLKRQGVKPGGLVGICLERSLEMVIGLLGILKAGGAYIPLDPTYPQERLAFMLEDAQVSVLLTQEKLLHLLPQSKAKIIPMDAAWPAISQADKNNLAGQITPDHLAYVIYTSGSTGKPKGVQIPHRAVVNFLNSMRQQPGLTEKDILLSVTTLSFDIAALELFLPLVVGAQLVIAGSDATVDGVRLSDKLNSSGATVMQATPATWQLLLATGWQGNNRLKILCGGEALSRELATQLLEKSDSVWNLYGPTETTIWSTIYRVEPTGNSIYIGRPIANTQIYILDRHLKPLPVGVPGELYIGGIGLSRGYLNRPELTAEKFIPNPFSQNPQDRLYKTGDLARYLPDGNIEFLGRIDHQIKLRGFRIELGEIEALLNKHPDVREAVALVREDVPGDKRLVAYLVPKRKADISINELRDFLKLKLPDYMIPSAFVILDALPLTPNGKVNRRALPSPDQTRPEEQETFVPPRDELERQLTQIWEQVLGVCPVGIRDNFFDLGGYSLLGVRLFAQIKQTFNKNLPMATLFQSPTVEQLANVLRDNRKKREVTLSTLVTMQPNGSRPPFFCLPGNLGNVFIDLGDLAQHLGSDQPFYGFQDGIQNPTHIKGLAAHYLKEMQTVQPEGPYFLGGVCSGGIIAFEMAQQLQTQGQKVALLALIEPPSPQTPGLRTYINFVVSILRRIGQRFVYHSNNFLDLDSSERGAYTHLKFKLIANLWAMKRYAPQPYPGSTHLFLTSESLRLTYNPQFGWRDLSAGGAKIYEIPGTHNAITGANGTKIDEAHMQALGKQLQACIEEVLFNSNNYPIKT